MRCRKYSNSRSCPHALSSGCHHNRSIQFRPGFHERARNHKSLYKLYANGEDLHGSGNHFGLPLERCVAMQRKWSTGCFDPFRGKPLVGPSAWPILRIRYTSPPCRLGAISRSAITLIRPRLAVPVTLGSDSWHPNRHGTTEYSHFPSSLLSKLQGSGFCPGETFPHWIRQPSLDTPTCRFIPALSELPVIRSVDWLSTCALRRYYVSWKDDRLEIT